MRDYRVMCYTVVSAAISETAIEQRSLGRMVFNTVLQYGSRDMWNQCQGALSLLWWSVKPQMLRAIHGNLAKSDLHDTVVEMYHGMNKRDFLKWKSFQNNL